MNPAKIANVVALAIFQEEICLKSKIHAPKNSGCKQFISQQDKCYSFDNAPAQVYDQGFFAILPEKWFVE